MWWKKGLFVLQVPSLLVFIFFWWDCEESVLGALLISKRSPSLSGRQTGPTPGSGPAEVQWCAGGDPYLQTGLPQPYRLPGVQTEVAESD